MTSISKGVDGGLQCLQTSMHIIPAAIYNQLASYSLIVIISLADL